MSEATRGNTDLTVEFVQSEPERTLVISFDGDTPTFEFQGTWAGKHIDTIKRLVSREYVKYQRDIRINERRKK